MALFASAADGAATSADGAAAWLEDAIRRLAQKPTDLDSALLAFCKSEHAVIAAKMVLDRSSDPTTQFFAVMALQCAALGIWSQIGGQEKHSLRSYLWDLWANQRERSSMEKALMRQVLQTFCVLWKWDWADESEEGKRALLSTLADLSKSDDISTVAKALKALRALVQEFSSARQARLTVPLEFHARARRAFDQVGLDETLAIGVQVLCRLADAVTDTSAAAPNNRSDAPPSTDAPVPAIGPDDCAVLALELVIEALSWEFGERAAWQLPQSDELVTPGPRWRPLLVRQDFLSAIFAIFRRSRFAWKWEAAARRQDPDSSIRRAMHKWMSTDPENMVITEVSFLVRQLLIQLCSVSGDIFADEQQRASYASFLLEGVASALASPLGGPEIAAAPCEQQTAADGAEGALSEAFEKETRDLATMSGSLLANFGLDRLRGLAAFESFVRGLAGLTQGVLSGAVADAAARSSESWRQECLGTLLNAWASLLGHRSLQTGQDVHLRAALSKLVRPLYSGYVDARVAIARAQVESTPDDEYSEDELIESVDLDEQMAAAASLGRISPAASFSLLTQRLEAAARALAEMATTGAVNGRPMLVQQQQQQQAGENEAVLSPEASALLEEARILVLLAGHLLADDDSGEAAMLPEALQHGLAQDPQAAEALQRLGRLLVEFLRFESRRLATSPNGADDVTLSPYLADGLLWCISRWARTCLLPDLSLYLSGVEPQLIAIFGYEPAAASLLAATAAVAAGGSVSNGGAASDASSALQSASKAANERNGARNRAVVSGEAKALVAVLLEAAWLYLCRWHAQPDVVREVLGLLDVLASRQVAPTTCAVPLLADIVAAHGRPKTLGSNNNNNNSSLNGASSSGHDGFRRLPIDSRRLLAARLLKCALNSVVALPNGDQNNHNGGAVASSAVAAAAAAAAAAVAAPIRDRFARLVGASAHMSAAQRQTVEVVDESLLCVALCRGVVLASTEGASSIGSSGGGGGGSGVENGVVNVLSQADVGRDYVDGWLQGMVELLRMNVSGAAAVVCEVLEFLKDVSEIQLPLMTPRRAIALYDACGTAIRLYADHHWGQHKGYDPSAEEEAYADVLCVLQLLGFLVVKDVVDFDDGPRLEGERLKQAVPEVAFFGLSRVMPLMTEGLLHFPKLAEHHFALVGFLVEQFPDRLPALDFNLFRQLVQSLLFGVQQAPAHSARTSLKALCELAEWHAACVASNNSQGLNHQLAQWPSLFTDCLQPLLQLLVFEACVWDRLDAAADAVNALVTCERAGFARMAEGFICRQPQREGGRLSVAFRTLFAEDNSNVSGLGMRRGDRARRERFRERMKRFVTDVRAFMLNG